MGAVRSADHTIGGTRLPHRPCCVTGTLLIFLQQFLLHAYQIGGTIFAISALFALAVDFWCSENKITIFNKGMRIFPLQQMHIYSWNI